jgi:hypothetical protein
MDMLIMLAIGCIHHIEDFFDKGFYSRDWGTDFIIDDLAEYGE